MQDGSTSVLCHSVFFAVNHDCLGLAVPQQAASAKVMHGIRFTDEHIRKTVKDEDYPEASTKYAVALQTSRSVQGIHVEDVPQSRGVLLSEDYPEVTTVKLSHERPPFDKVRDFMNTRAAHVSVMNVSVDEEEAKTTPISNGKLIQTCCTRTISVMIFSGISFLFFCIK